LDELAEMIEEMDPEAEEKVNELYNRAAGLVDGKLLRQLVQQIGGYEFDEAADTLDKIRAALALA
jgi:hypothetical protein